MASEAGAGNTVLTGRWSNRPRTVAGQQGEIVMHRDSKRCAVLGTVLGTALATFGNTALAQTADESQELEEVTVTGSRIQRATGFTTPVPVTSVSRRR